MDIRVQAILSSLWPAARRPLAPFLVLGVDILDALDLASGEEASPPAIYEPEPGVAQELDGSRWVVDVDPAHRGHFLITPSPGQEPVEGVFRRDGVWVQGWQGQPEGIWREGRWLPGMPAPEALHFDPFRSWEDFGRTLGLRYGFPDLSDHHYTVPISVGLEMGSLSAALMVSAERRSTVRIPRGAGPGLWHTQRPSGLCSGTGGQGLRREKLVSKEAFCWFLAAFPGRHRNIVPWQCLSSTA